MNKPDEQHRPSFWGKGVAIVMSFFVLLLLGMGGYVAQQRIDLVQDDYYDRGLAYQTQIDKLERTRALPEKPTIDFSLRTEEVIIEYPARFEPASVAGEVKLYRPSDSRLDREFPLALDSTGVQIIDVSRLARGRWKVIVEWQVDTVTYLTQDVIFVN